MKKFRSTFFPVFCLIAFLLLLTPDIQSAEKKAYPDRNIKIIIPFSPGSSIDFVMRGTAPYLEKILGVRLILTNEAGADGRIGYTKIYKAKPDGYTYGIVGLPPLPLAFAVRAVKFRAEEFTPVFAWTRDNQILFVNSETWKTFDEFVKTGEKEFISIGTTALGASSSHLAGVLLANNLKLKFRFIGYEGSGEMLAALAGKHIQGVVSMPQSAIGLAKAGKLRPLLSFASEVDPVMPDAPTPKSLGYDISPLPYFRGLVGPPKIPQSLVVTIEAAFKKTLENAEYQAWAKERKVNLISMPAEQFGKEIRRESEIVGKYGELLEARH